ncbi:MULTISPECIES: helix-turn-helix domain-containing protein [Serratia]|uniref:Helix-turn-helix domain-containing protein n=1 Tax=Serratia marcescens TaxID=615 RepID=A0A221DTR1_SERMA|nr:helix-turn-helix domain-containing protein [Serratia marcescens]ASL89061.1 transcriptional regulator [Serratia marcescens]TXE26185.1 helix-turn-helix domain-containing protein [Serratia marcescens]TXE54400.1 helix-turn-helix domain-containing protein [Serratia marcescens]HEJ7121065.1 helix-turn-helix domain-containing protein [Serratia marcescens]
MNTGNSLSHRAKARRIELGLTQAEVAELAGITQQSYQQLEAGETKRPRNLLEISSALKCTAHWLMYGKRKLSS